MKFASCAHRFTGRRLSYSVALLSLVLSSCNSTGTGGQGLQLAGNSSDSVLTESLQSAADQKNAAAAGAPQEGVDKQALEKQPPEKQEGKEEKQQPVPSTEAKQAALKTEAPAAPASETTEGQQAQLAEATPATEKTEKKARSLMSLFGAKEESSPQPAEADTQATTPATADSDVTQAAKAPTTPVQPEQPQAQQTARSGSPEKPVQVTSLFGGAPKSANAFATPQRPNASEGSIARLFADEADNGRSNRSENKKLAVIKPASATAKHDYNYTLPGVRANGGFEIKHRNSLADDSDIDANEDDEYPGVTLASAPGLARLAPNGLKVQRQTVDVACLKPQLVTMLRTMERHFRRPVMVTSGYRNPSYNLKVGGARKSLHMICAAADIQIEGVSKWEIARYARSMPGRGGVGTYCHTTSVHVDIGPEREWNWRCKR